MPLVFRPVTKQPRRRSRPSARSRFRLPQHRQEDGLETGISTEVNGLTPCATAATKALSHEADITKVQEWLGHVNVSTTRLYDRRKVRPEDSPTFRVRY